MGKSLAGLFGGGSGSSTKKISKLKNLLSLAVTRLAILKNQHQARCSLAHSDIAQLLQLGHCYDDRALLRAEIVVKEENMLDVFAMIQSYCHLITERSLLIQRQKECPHELKEAVSSLIYASSRSGEMPELQQVCNLFSSMFGREFVRAATELRNSCGVNPKIVQKLSTRQPSLESRVRIINEVAAEKGITLHLASEDAEISMADPNSVKNKNQTQVGVDSGRDSSSRRSAHNYKDVVSAAQAAFEKAEDAAAAAKAAVELSRSSQSSSDDHDNRRNGDQRKNDDGLKEDQNKDGPEQLDEKSKFDKGKIHPVQYYTWESEEEDALLYSEKRRELGHEKFMEGTEQFRSGFNSDSSEAPLQENKRALFDDKSESETGQQWGLNSDDTGKLSLKMERQFSATSIEGLPEKQAASFLNPPFLKTYPERKFSERTENDTTGLLDAAFEDNLANCYYSETTSPGTETAHIDYTKKSATQQSKVTRRAVSVRTRRGMHK